MDRERIERKVKLSSQSADPHADSLPAIPVLDDTEDSHAKDGSASTVRSSVPLSFVSVLRSAIFSVFGYCIFLHFFFTGVGDLVEQDQSKTWQKTTAVVITSGLNENDHWPRARWTVPVQVVYKYSVSGHEYRSSRINFCRAFSSYENFSGPAYKALIAACKPKARVQVFVDPRAPQNSVIDPT